MFHIGTFNVKIENFLLIYFESNILMTNKIERWKGGGGTEGSEVALQLERGLFIF